MKKLVLITALMLFPTFANAKISPSFDCKKASTEVEKLICSNEELAKLDVEMNKSYKAFMGSLEEEYYQKKLKRKQRDWLGYRKTLSCFNGNDEKKTKCLINMYQVRVKNLNAWTKRENYDFFREYEDHVDYLTKFVSVDGEEYYFSCAGGTIYSRLPNKEKIEFYSSGNVNWSPPVLQKIIQDEKKIFIRCDARLMWEGDKVVDKDYENSFWNYAIKKRKIKIIGENEKYAVLIELKLKNIDELVSLDLLSEKNSNLAISDNKNVLLKEYGNLEELMVKEKLKCPRNLFKDFLSNSEFRYYDITSKYALLIGIFYKSPETVIDIAPKYCFLDKKTCGCLEKGEGKFVEVKKLDDR